MSLESDICLLLLANAGVQTAMGSATPAVYMGAVPMAMPDNPAVVIRLAHTDRYNTAQGVLNFKKKRVQFDSYDEVYTTALSISSAVYAAIETLAQPFTNLNTTTVYGAILEAEQDMPQEAGDGGYVLRRTFFADIFYADNNP